METKIYLDAVKGDDSKGILGNIDLPFKTLDSAYGKLRESGPGGVGSFNSDVGIQHLQLESYSNIKVTGNGCIKITSKMTLDSVVFECPVLIELPVNTTPDSLVSLKGNVKLIGLLTITEAVYSKKVSYSFKTVFFNEGNFETSGTTIIRVNRMLTFIQNNKEMKVQAPSVDYQGGDLFLSGKDSKTCIYGSFPVNFKVSPGINSGYILSGYRYNTFCYGHFSGNALVDNVNLSITVNQDLDASTPLFVLENEVSLTLKNSNLKSNTKMVLCNTERFTKINTILDNIVQNKTLVRIKKIKDTYIIDDTDGDIFHIDFSGLPSKSIEVIIPDELVVGQKELFFNKINAHPNNKLIIKVNNVHHNSNFKYAGTGSVTLDYSKSQICLYKDEGTWYIKYIC